jgi:aminopeptidase
VHEDFMIGSHELNVDGVTKDGVREPIMRNGEWAISI